MSNRKISKVTRARVLKKYGNMCINCGSTEEIELHHVVPLEIGGYDIESNIVPLCYYCHKAVTHHELLLYTTGRQHKAGGRKRIIPTDYKDTLGKYVRCEIGAKECKKLLGISEKTHISDNPWFKKYLNENEIESCRNNVDIRISNNGINYGDCVGYVKYIDGNKQKMYWAGETIMGRKKGLPLFYFTYDKEIVNAY